MEMMEIYIHIPVHNRMLEILVHIPVDFACVVNFLDNFDFCLPVSVPSRLCAALSAYADWYTRNCDSGTHIKRHYTTCETGILHAYYLPY
jgi:hypothetical protein